MRSPFICAALAALGGASAHTEGGELLINTLAGPVQGVYDDSGLNVAPVRHWGGIQYGAPPVGEKRFCDADAALPWTEARASDDNTPGCQQTCGLPPGTCPKVVDEDCLYLSVWAPNATDATTADAPVFVWFPGGAFEQGSGADCSLYDGATMASRQSVVTVTVTYRVGVFGFLASESMEGSAGFSDQRLALKWVQDNIKAFGGDPGRVTIGGQSAGGMSVSSHLVDPKSEGLFHQAIMQSNPLAIPYHTAESAADGPAADIAKSVGFDRDDVACMQATSIEDLLAAQKVADDDVNTHDLLSAFLQWGPIVSANGLPGQPIDQLRNGDWAKVPLLAGYMAEDALLFVYEAFPSAVKKMAYKTSMDLLFGLQTGKKVKAIYPPDSEGDTSDTRPVISTMGTDFLFHCPLRNITASMAKDAPVYLYKFDHVTSFDPWGPDYSFCVGHACHGSELPFEFEMFGSDDVVYDPTADEVDLAVKTSSLWGAFIHGDPNDAGIDEKWPLYAAESDEMLVLDTPELSTTAFDRASFCDAWDALGYAQDDW